MTRETTIQIRLSVEDKEAFEAAAKAEERSISDWVRFHLRRACKADLDTELVEAFEQAKAKYLQPKVPRGTRLPADWCPSSELLEWTRKTGRFEGASPVVEMVQNFRDYWTAKPGKDGTKLDWEATWRNWVRKDAEWRAASQSKAQKRAQFAAEIWGTHERPESDITGESERLA